MAILWDFFSVFPANAGMIPDRPSATARASCVPRECGDDPTGLPSIPFASVFPANAGMIPRSRESRERTEKRVPRECGDDPAHKLTFSEVYECSPRMRG